MSRHPSLLVAGGFVLTLGCATHASGPAAAVDTSKEDSGMTTTDDSSSGEPTESGGADSSGTWGAAYCPPPPSGVKTGFATGDQLGSVALKDCDDKDVSLDAFCGADALWLFAAHEWCPHCQKVTSEAEGIYASYAGKNVAMVNVLVQNTAGARPTAADCRAWQTTYHLTNVVALYDPTGAMKPLWDNSYTALSVFVDRNRVIVSKAHTDDPVALKAGIDGALSH